MGKGIAGGCEGGKEHDSFASVLRRWLRRRWARIESRGMEARHEGEKCIKSNVADERSDTVVPLRSEREYETILVYEKCPAGCRSLPLDRYSVSGCQFTIIPTKATQCVLEAFNRADKSRHSIVQAKKFKHLQ